MWISSKGEGIGKWVRSGSVTSWSRGGVGRRRVGEGVGKRLGSDDVTCREEGDVDNFVRLCSVIFNPCGSEEIDTDWEGF